MQHFSDGFGVVFILIACKGFELIKHVINRAQKKLSSVGAYENSKKAALEAKLRKKEVFILLSEFYIQI